MNDEGADLPQVNGVMTAEDIDRFNNHALIAGKDYSCQICGQTYKAPFVYRCLCGLRVCEKCESDHMSGW